MIEYQHDVKKFAIGGLQLNLPPDLVPPTQYSQLDNAVSRIEGRLETRDGSVLLCTIGTAPIHSLYRLNQFINAVNGERLFGMSTRLFTAPLPNGNIPTELLNYIVADTQYPAFPVAFNGKPLSIATFRFDGDPQNWAIIANGQRMMKRKQSYYEQLGLPAPTVQPIASAGGGGNLTGDYQWYYTYVNEVTLSESNPSLASIAGVAPGPEVLRPTAFTNPSTNIGNPGSPVVPWANPANAFDNNPATFAQGAGFPPGGGVATCIWSGFPAASATYTSLELHIIIQAQSATSVTGVVARYSLDGGVTWNVAYQSFSAAGQQELIIALDPSQSIPLIQVYGGAGERFGGGFNILNIYEIFTVGVIAGGGAFLSLAAQSAVVCVAAPVDPQETAIRLYRIGGTLQDVPRFVVQERVADLLIGACGAGYLEMDDNVADGDIAASQTLQTDNDMPVHSVNVTNLPIDAIWPFDERILGCGDPNRPTSVYFSKRGNADAWPTENFIQVCDPGDQMMIGLNWALRCFVFSREGLFQLLPNIIAGVTFTPAKTSCRRGLKGKQASAVGRKGIYFVSKDGIFRTAGAEEEPVHNDIGPLFPTRDGPGRTVGVYEAVNMDDEDGLRLQYHNDEIWFDYTGKDTGRRRRLIYNENLNRWRSEVYIVQAQMCYSELGTKSSLLVGLIDGTVRQGDADLEGGVNVVAQTGAYDQGQPLNLKEYANVVFDLDTGGVQVTITPYINGDQTAAPPLVIPAGGGRVRVAISLSDVYALNMSFLIQWGAQPANLPIMYQMDIFYRIEPAAMNHWEVPPYALGSNGWFHMRDAYVTVRSESDVTLTVTPDNGLPFALTIPSTAGKKQKVYLRFPPNKAKLAQFSFDSAADFRLYQEECELRVKPWVQPLGYTVIPLFGAEAQGGK